MTTDNEHPLSPGDLNALAGLLDVNDPAIVDTLRKNLAGMPQGDYELLLARFGAGTFPPVLLEAQSERAMRDFFEITSVKEPDLEKALVAISAWGRPDLPARRVHHELDRIAAGIREPESDNAAKIRSICRKLFSDRGLIGNRANYYNPDNSFIGVVLDTRLGIPISLASIFLLVGKRVGADVLPIGSPGTFLLGADLDGTRRFIDCYAGGKILERKEALELIPALHLGEPFPIVDTKEIIARTLRNLHRIYLMRSDHDRTADVADMLANVSNE